MIAPEGGAGGGGIGTKIGAGHKPQGYDAHGRYTGPQGGAISTDGGPVRLFANEADGGAGGEESTDEDAGAEQGEATEDIAQELEGVLVADSGQILSDAGGEETKAPAKITWKNDDPNKPDPRKEDLTPTAQNAMEEMKTEVPKLDSVNTNSGRRPYDPAKPNDPHAHGRAVDINNINGVRVKDLQSGTGEKAERAREAAANLEDWAKKNPDVTQVIGPTGRWESNGSGDMDKRVPVEPKDFKILQEHKNHYHITIHR